MSKNVGIKKPTNLLLIVLIAGLISSCIPDLGSLIGNTQEPVPTPTTVALPPQAEITFRVTIPVNSPDKKVYLDVLDEVTGLALNPFRMVMTKEDATHFSAIIPVNLGSVIKYKYLLDGTPPTTEKTTQGTQVRYRIFNITSPGIVEDIVSAWGELPFEGKTGRIMGQVVSSVDNSPIPGVLVACNGLQTLTTSDGSYVLEGIPAGTHNLVAYTLDGSHEIFQQGALIAEESTTPAPIRLTPAKMVNVTFYVNIPEGNITGVPVRIIGNIYQLGNTFADLQGGISTIAARAPLMKLEQAGRYSLTMKLPTGLDLRYKYTLGDGFWNAEHYLDGRFRLRQFIVPAEDKIIENTVDTWKSGSSAPISFTVKVPANTPANNTVSIQFNPYGWTEPIPMWPIGNQQWLFMLYSPLDMLGNVGYRYCRNDQCGVADAVNTAGSTSSGIPFSTSLVAQSIQDDVTKWIWWNPNGTPTPVLTTEVKPRSEYFAAGVEFLPFYHPSWPAYYDWALQNIQQAKSNTLVVTPTWHLTRINLPVLEQVPGQDGLWQDWINTSALAQKRGLDIYLYPKVIYAGTSAEWWGQSNRDDGWWTSWFDRYSTFIIHHADLASKVGAKALILGDPDISATFPVGYMPDGTPSNVPLDAPERWQQLIKHVREHYSGKIGWVVSLPAGITPLPSFIGDVDLIYVEFSGKVSNTAQTDPKLIAGEFGRLLDTQILPIKENYAKTVILAIKYPSADGAATGCIPLGVDCIPFNLLDTPNKPGQQPVIDLNEQVDIYNGALVAVNERSWINGFISRGYNPSVVIQDASSSIYGKPASDVLWYWYPKMVK
jgi:hypothetical protein